MKTLTLKPTKDRYYIDYGTFMTPLVKDRTTNEVVASFKCLGYVLEGKSHTNDNKKKIFSCASVPSRVVDRIIESLNRGEIDLDGRLVAEKD